MTDIAYTTLSTATTVGTGNATDGAGNFDNLMKVVTLHLEAQFAAGRITGTDYATVYLGALQSTLAQAVSFTLSMNKANEEATLLEKQQSKVDAEIALLGQKKITEYAQTGKTSNALPDASSIAGKQITLFTQQAKGFKWNADAKYLKSLLDAYAINVSVSKDNDTATAKLQGGTSTASIKGAIDTYAPTG
jgi:hypothetical protein